MGGSSASERSLLGASSWAVFFVILGFFEQRRPVHVGAAVLLVVRTAMHDEMLQRETRPFFGLASEALRFGQGAERFSGTSPSEGLSV
jgi:hypothetical protein